MGRTTIAIVGWSWLIMAAGCSSAASGAADAAASDARAVLAPDAESEDSSPSAEADAASLSAAACTAAGGVCQTTAICVVVGPVNCGSGAICCMGATTAAPIAPQDAATNVCGSNACPDDAGIPEDAPAGG